MDSDGAGSSGTGNSSTGDTVTAATAETITAAELVGTSWSFSYGDSSTRTLKFESETDVTYSYNSDDYSESYKYAVDGSMVTIIDYYDDNWDMQLIYLSGQLVYVAMTLTPAGSSASGSSISLAGTTWTGTEDDFIMRIEFQSGGKVVMYPYDNSQYAISGTYSASGSTVTATMNAVDSITDGGDVQLVYSSGQLIYARWIFTKG